MVNHPAECPWSSYRVNAQGETSRVLMEHPLYKSQGTDEVERHSVYHELFRYELDPGVIDEIRSATNRITSYNVCYTKLLRIATHIAVSVCSYRLRDDDLGAAKHTDGKYQESKGGDSAETYACEG